MSAAGEARHLDRPEGQNLMLSMDFMVDCLEDNMSDTSASSNHYWPLHRSILNLTRSLIAAGYKSPIQFEGKAIKLDA